MGGFSCLAVLFCPDSSPLPRFFVLSGTREWTSYEFRPERRRGDATDETAGPRGTAAAAASGGGGRGGCHSGRYPAFPHRLRGVGSGGGDGAVLPAEAAAVLPGPAGGQDHPPGQPEKVAGKAAEGWIHAGFGECFRLGG